MTSFLRLPYCVVVMCLAVLFFVWNTTAGASELPPLKVLYLGDNGHHHPRDRYDQLAPVMARRNIAITYTDDLSQLRDAGLKPYDVLMIYANIDVLPPENEAALLRFVRQGKGFAPIHCASFCFRNSPAYIALVGAQFQKHGFETFRVRQEPIDHPILKGYGGFESADETYIHTLHNPKGRTVLEYRPDKTGDEPWTWVRNEGEGRVFYTAWGHDHRTFGHPGFHNLVERGLRWVAKQDVSVVPGYQQRADFKPWQMTRLPTNPKPFEYIDVGKEIPNYPAGEKWGKQEENLSKMQVPLDPAESMKHYVVPTGSALKLYASEPQLGGKPIAVTWNERGQLYICETIDYPNELQPATGRDRIRLCTDTDNDGVADKFSVFAEGLSIPAAIVAAQGGVLVQNGIETLFLKDTDGDGKADIRKVLMTGWALGDTHGGVSNFQYGVDNWIWGMQGYNDSTPVLDNGEKTQRFRQGFFRFKLAAGADGLPTVTQMEFLRSTDNNTWGLGFSEDGLVFGSTANHNPSNYLPIPNRYYERVRGAGPEVLHTIADSHLFKAITDKVRQMDHHGGYTAGCGHALYTARNYPENWWNRLAFVCEPTGHLVGTFVLNREGADFHSTSPVNLVASDDEWASPTMAEVGPDGNMWIVDWYNFIIQHNPTPAGFKTGKGNAYETKLRDKKHGRIYRLEWQAPEGVTVGKSTTHDLAGKSDAELVKVLADDNFFWRRQAQRLLIEHKAVSQEAALLALLADPKVDAIGLNVGAMHALWTLEGLGLIKTPSDAARQGVIAALTHTSAGVRRAAALACGHMAGGASILVKAGVLEDEHPLVRLGTLLALADQTPSAEAATALLATLNDPTNLADRWLPDAVMMAAATNDAGFLTQLSSLQEPLNPVAIKIVTRVAEHDYIQLASSYRHVAMKIVTRVAEHYARGEQPADLSSVLAGMSKARPEVAAAIVTGLANGWPRQRTATLTSADEEALVAAFDRMSPEGRTSLFQLSARLGTKRLEARAAELSQSYLHTAEDEKASDKDRLAAARQVLELRRSDAGAVESLLKTIGVRSSPEYTSGLMAALALSDAPTGGSLIIGKLAAITPSAKGAAYRTILSRADWTKSLLEACESGTANLNDLVIDQKQALAGHPDKQIAERAKMLLAKGGGLPNADRQAVIDSLSAIIKAAGDANAGHALYKQHCSKCHTFKGEGQKIGPDLTGMSVHPKAELLIHIMDPSRSVEGNFRSYTAALDDGRVITGLLGGETRTSLQLIDAEGKSQTVQRSEVEELVASTKSLMPEGFEKQMSPQQVNDLLEYLTQKPKYLPVSLEKFATVNTTHGMFYDEKNAGERLVFKDWSPKTFAGVPFVLIDPTSRPQNNAIMLFGPQGKFAPKMPRNISLPCSGPLKSIHILGGIGGWSFPASGKGSVSMIVRIHYADGSTEDHPLKNGEVFADYIRRVDVPDSQFAFDLDGRQVRYLHVEPKKTEPVTSVEFVKGPDTTAPVTMAVTFEFPDR